METRAEVEALLSQWVARTTARDAERLADLFQRQPAPLVTFTDGERAGDWLDIRLRLGRDLSRAIVDRVEVHHVSVRELGEEHIACSFAYDLSVRDLWGMPATVTRLASMTLVRTKDGLRIATAHFAAPPE